VAALRAGELVGVFPEATMSRSLEIKDIKNGAVRMAVAAKVPVIPMIVFGGQRLLGYGVRDFTRGRTIAITIGEPMQVARTDDPDEATARLRSNLEALLDETIARYPRPTSAEREAGAWWLPARHGGTAPTPQEALLIEERKRMERAAKAPGVKDR
jgi:1-acyl-sn-glycerol-3-phosphate acyltransferase